MTEIYRITDGTTVISLLNGVNVISLNHDGGAKAVLPQLPPWKAGGTWQSSPLSDSRRLVNRQFGNIVDTHDIIASAQSQDALIYGLQELWRLLNKSVDYWATDWQNEPVWLEARSDCETNIRYAIINAWSTPNIDDPYTSPFSKVSPPNAMEELTLTLEHTIWMGYAPGSEECVEVSGEQLRYETFGSDTGIPTIGTDDGRYEKIAATVSTAFVVLEIGQPFYDIMIRFRGMAIPQGATIVDSYVTLEAAVNTTGVGFTDIAGELSATPTALIPGDTADYLGRPVTADVINWNIPTLIINNTYDTPNLSAIIQEITDLVTWGSGNDIMLFFKPFAQNATGPNPLFFSGETVGSEPILTVEYVDGTQTQGRGATCDNEVYVANKNNRAQITHIFIDDGGAFGGNLIGAGLPYSLFPNPVAVNDALYVCSSTASPYGGPFASIVFDLANTSTGLDCKLEYWDGGAWTDLEFFDTTFRFTNAVVGSFVWKEVPDWVPNIVNGVTGYWVRFLVNAAEALNIVQQNRDPYSVLWSAATLASDQILGDLPALIKTLLYNQSSGINQSTLGPPEESFASADRVIVGTRSTSRGDLFQMFINFSDTQNPSHIGIEVGTNCTLSTRSEAPTGRAAVFNPGVAAEGLVMRARLSLSPELTTAYYGRHHLFVRVMQIDGDLGDFSVSVDLLSKYRSGVFYSSETVTVPVIEGFPFLDFGEIELQPSDLPISDLFIQVNASVLANGSPGDLIIYDAALVPIDEFALDVVNANSTINGILAYEDWGRYLRIGLNYKRQNDTKLVGPDGNINNWLSIGTTPLQLQANSEQYLNILAMRLHRVNATHDGGNNLAFLSDTGVDFLSSGVRAGDIIYNRNDGSYAVVTGVGGANNKEVYGTLQGGTDNDWDNGDEGVIITQTWVGEPRTTHTIQLFKQQRYQVMRGAR